MEPTYLNIAYGEHERHRIDLYLAKSDWPTPMYLHIHGGGFRHGDKSGVSGRMVEELNSAGISVASMNYRLTGTDPYPAPFDDGVRAVQFLRFKSKEYGLDKDRFGCGGRSAGGGITFWIGFKPDRADPEHEDPVCRESSRLQCIASNDAQSSYDCNFIKTIISGPAWKESALLELFRLQPEQFDTADAKRMFYESSALNHVTSESPPVCLSFARHDVPMSEEIDSGHGIHHPVFGRLLKEKMDSLGVHCEVHYREDVGDLDEDAAKEALLDKRLAFLKERLL